MILVVRLGQLTEKCDDFSGEIRSAHRHIFTTSFTLENDWILFYFVIDPSTKISPVYIRIASSGQKFAVHAVDGSTGTVIRHPEQPGCLAAMLLADDPDIKPRHFGDVMSTGKLLSLNVYFQIEMEN
jgi:hypothetical protein